MADAMLIISREEFIEILTKSGRYNREGVETVLDNGGLACAIETIVLDAEHEADRSEHYKGRCQQLKEEVESLNHLLDKYEDQSKSEVDRWMNM